MGMVHQSGKRSRNRLALGATLIEFLCALVLVVFVVLGALLGRSAIVSWLGYLVGGSLGALAFFVLVMALAAVLALWKGPGLPSCRNGCCRGPGLLFGHGDYRTERIGDESFIVCRCGDRYKLYGRRFILANEQGMDTRYLIWRRFRGWRADTE